MKPILLTSVILGLISFRYTQEQHKKNDKAVAHIEEEEEEEYTVQVPMADDMVESVAELQLRAALLAWVTLGNHDRIPVTFISHCRNAKEGCITRITNFAMYFIDAAEAYEVDPWLLASIAIKESSLNPSSLGKHGEVGLMQLHPKSRIGARVRVQCKKEPGDCNRLHIFAAAEYLAYMLKTCRTVDIALNAYNSGRCIESDYADKIKHIRDTLLHEAAIESRFEPAFL